MFGDYINLDFAIADLPAAIAAFQTCLIGTRGLKASQNTAMQPQQQHGLRIPPWRYFFSEIHAIAFDRWEIPTPPSPKLCQLQDNKIFKMFLIVQLCFRPIKNWNLKKKGKLN